MKSKDFVGLIWKVRNVYLSFFLLYKYVLKGKYVF